MKSLLILVVFLVMYGNIQAQSTADSTASSQAAAEKVAAEKAAAEKAAAEKAAAEKAAAEKAAAEKAAAEKAAAEKAAVKKIADEGMTSEQLVTPEVIAELETAELDNHKWIETHGYARSGYGVNKEGGRMNSFIAPGAGAKLRLGNENDNYGEMDIITLWPAEKDMPQAKFHFMFSYWSMWNSGAEKFGGDYGAWEVRQIFTEINNIPIFNPEVTFWAGVRYYDRWQIDINDFFHLDYSGYGGGVQNIPIGSTNLNIAWLNQNNTDGIELGDPGSHPTDTASFVNKHSLMNSTFEFRLKDLPLLFGNVELIAAPSYIRGGQDIYVEEDNAHPSLDTLVNVDGIFGFGISAAHIIRTDKGIYNRISVQYGSGQGYNFKLDIPTPFKDKWMFGEYDARDISRFRITESATFPAGKFTIMPVAVFEVTDYAGEQDVWAQIGVRPSYNFTKRFSLALDAALDYVNLESSMYQPNMRTSTKGTLGKITLAPVYNLNGPQLRIFGSYFMWPEEFNGYVVAPNGPGESLNNIYANAKATSDFVVGVQMDVWW